MRFADSNPGKLLPAGCALLLLCSAAWAGTSSKVTPPAKNPASKARTVSARNPSRKGKSRRSAANWRRGQQKIDSSRAREIQEALIREHYFDGNASGVWDDASQKAMERYQAANGWQTKTIPDSRALIRLGLGPDHEHLLNPESAMTSEPRAPHGAALSTPAAAPAATDPQK